MGAGDGIRTRDTLLGRQARVLPPPKCFPRLVPGRSRNDFDRLGPVRWRQAHYRQSNLRPVYRLDRPQCKSFEQSLRESRRVARNIAKFVERLVQFLSAGARKGARGARVTEFLQVGNGKRISRQGCIRVSRSLTRVSTGFSWSTRLLSGQEE